MKDNREDEKAYAAFIEKEEFLPYLKNISNEVNASMAKPFNSISPFIPGIFVLAGYSKLDKRFYPILEQYLDVCIDRCEDFEDSHKVEIQLCRLTKYLHHLDDLHVNIDGVPMSERLGAKVMHHLVGYFWYDYCDDQDNKETVG